MMLGAAAFVGFSMFGNVGQVGGDYTWGELADIYGFETPEKLEDHFQRHGNEVGADKQEIYLEKAKQFFNSKVDGKMVQEGFRSNGDRILFNRFTGEFGVQSANGTIRTYFIPKGGYEYFIRQF